MIISLSAYDADHPLVHSAPRSCVGVMYRSSGLRRFQIATDDGESIDVSGADLEEWVRLYGSLGSRATSDWESHGI